jgi:hypothetical protein
MKRPHARGGCTNLSQPPGAGAPTIAPSQEASPMKQEPQGQAAHYRESAARFRQMADIEPLASLRRHLKRLAAQHDEIAASLEMQTAE